MTYNDITKMAPTATLWVQAGATEGGNGSAGQPFSSIQLAVNHAVPGTAIMVREGTYIENVKFPSTGGTNDAPIWLLSADGPGAAHIMAKTPTSSVILGLGTDNVMVDGFKIEGGHNGIQFSQSGSHFTNMVSNIVVSNNTIISSAADGIKISQADNVQILNNTVIGADDQAIDFVAVNDSRIVGNDVSQITGDAAIFAKGGSTNVLIANNYVHDVAVDGIILGGWTSERFYRPDFKEYEAKNIIVTGNYVEDVGKRPVNILGAVESEVSGNVLKANPDYFTVISVENGSPRWTSEFYSRDILITDNIFDRPNKLIAIHAGNGEGVVFTENRTDGIASFDFASVGPSETGWQPGFDAIAERVISVAVGNGGSAEQHTLRASSEGYVGDALAFNGGFAASAMAPEGASGMNTVSQPMLVPKVDVNDGGSGSGGLVDLSYNWELNATEFVVTGKWNSVKNILIESETATNVSLKNFVHTDVHLGGTGSSSIWVTDAKRANITTGSGNDTIDISIVTNEGKWENTFTVMSGAGNDTITFSPGQVNTVAKINDGRHSSVVIDAGEGQDIIDLSNLSLKLAAINAGAGNDTMTGSAGKDVYIYNAIADSGNGNDVITNFDVGMDQLQLNDDLGATLFASDIEGNLQVKLSDTTVITLIGVGIESAGLLVA